MGELTDRLRYIAFMSIWVICALLLMVRLIYLFLSDPQQFPINTIKIVASYQHITRQQLENVLLPYQHESFISLPVGRLKKELVALAWAETVDVERIWPDTLKISLREKMPVALWNDGMLTADGVFFRANEPVSDGVLPSLTGPDAQKTEVLQNYQKLSKLLSSYGLQAVALTLRDNGAWELRLATGIQLHLGKQDLEQRVLRFCRAYPAVFAEKPEQLSSVDLRYARGMAVQWKTPEQTMRR